VRRTKAFWWYHCCRGISASKKNNKDGIEALIDFHLDV